MRRRVRVIVKAIRDAAAAFFVWKKEGPKDHRVVVIVRGRVALDKT